IKTTGITYEIMWQAFAQARVGRLFILDKMNAVISTPRPELSIYAPRIMTIQIPVEKIGALIGPGGKTIRNICDTTGAQIDIEDDGRVFITTPDGEAAKKAISMIEGLTREAKVGDIFLGKVVSIKPFGAFVNILPGKDGMVHVSELDDKRVENVEDVVSLGDEINVMVIDIDRTTGKISLSRRAVLTGETPEERKAAGTAPRPRPREESRGGRDEQRGGREEPRSLREELRGPRRDADRPRPRRRDD
ncbi:MAG: S1 RNA-binding domain-containing protein, partial [Chloroflexus sp.]